MSQSASIATRYIAFLGLCVVGLALFYNPIVQLLGMSLHSELYDYIPAVPFVSLCILVYRRKAIFREFNWEWRRA